MLYCNTKHKKELLSIVAKFFYRILCGFLLGLSVFAPGLSGSVIAIIMGIYQDLLTIMSNPFKKLKQNILYILPLGIGAVISAVFFVITFKFLFDAYEKATYFLFIGLIAGNLPIILAEIKKSEFQKRYFIGGICAFAAALTLGILAIGVQEASTAEGIITELPIFALSGLISGIAALMPGMSVSMILIIMGVYSQLIFAAESLLHMNLTYLAQFGIFGVCLALGLVLASRGIKAVFEKYPGFANSMVFGFMAGSLIGILIESLKLSDANFSLLFGGIMLAAGLVVSMLFVVLGRVLNKA